MIINARQRATVLAALQYWHQYADHSVDSSECFHEHDPLDLDEIDALCEQINCDSLIDELLEYEAEAFDNDEEISGANLIEFIGDWRRRAKDQLEN